MNNKQLKESEMWVGGFVKVIRLALAEQDI